MTSADQIAGSVLRCDQPNWGPLEDLVGLQLAPWFMWTHSVWLADEAVLHAYKHVSTRRYVHVAEDGRAFLYTPPGDYREVTRRRAIALAFEGCESLLPQPDDPGSVRAAIRQAMIDCQRGPDGSASTAAGRSGPPTAQK